MYFPCMDLFVCLFFGNFPGFLWPVVTVRVKRRIYSESLLTTHSDHFTDFLTAANRHFRENELIRTSSVYILYKSEAREHHLPRIFPHLQVSDKIGPSAGAAAVVAAAGSTSRKFQHSKVRAAESWWSRGQCLSVPLWYVAWGGGKEDHSFDAVGLFIISTLNSWIAEVQTWVAPASKTTMVTRRVDRYPHLSSKFLLHGRPQSFRNNRAVVTRNRSHEFCVNLLRVIKDGSS